ncbi:MAG: GumC family protein [Nitrospirota bacterium]
MIDENEKHLRDYLKVIFKRKWISITFFFIVVTTVTIGTFSMKPLYKATTQLLIERENSNIVSIQEVLAVDATTTDYYQTQYEILKSKNIAARVIEKLKLSEHPEFNKITDSKKIGLLDSIFTKKDSTNRGDNTIQKRELTSSFLNRLKIEPVKNSRLVNISYESYNPELAAKIANAISEEYIGYSIEMKTNASQQAVEWLKKRVEEMEVKVRDSEESLERYKESIPGHILTEMKSKNSIAEMEMRPEVVKNRFIQNLREEEITLSSQLSELSQKYGPRHPKMIQLSSELSSLRKEIRHEIKKLVGAIKIEESSKYLLLKREVDTNRQLYEILLKRLKETILTENIPRSNYQIVYKAAMPQYPVRPKKRLNIILSIITGITGGIGLAFFFEYLDNTVKGPEDIERYIKLPLLGIVQSGVRSTHKSSDESIETITHTSPKSSFAESYRTIRTGILLSSIEKRPKTLLVTSSGPVEGKTTTSTNTAIAMSQLGGDVLLLDADLRRPRIHKIFNLENSTGLSTILIRESDTFSTIKNTNISNLFVITSGPMPPNPAELLGSQRMKEVLSEFGQRFKRIIIDSPPLISVTDSPILSTIADGTILVIKGGYTTKDVVITGKKRLEDVNSNIIGVILNNLDMTTSSYYYGYSSYYYYYGEEDKKAGKRNKRLSRV